MVDRRHRLEDLRRSLAAMPPRSPGLDREAAIRFVAEMQDLDRRLRWIRGELRRVMEEESEP